MNYVFTLFEMVPHAFMLYNVFMITQFYMFSGKTYFQHFSADLLDNRYPKEKNFRTQNSILPRSRATNCRSAIVGLWGECSNCDRLSLQIHKWSDCRYINCGSGPAFSRTLKAFGTIKSFNLQFRQDVLLAFATILQQVGVVR